MSNKSEQLKKADELFKKDEFAAAEEIYASILNNTTVQDSINNNVNELTILKLADLYVKIGDKEKLKEFIVNSTTFMAKFAKSKTAKILKILIEKFENIPDSLDEQIYVCEKSIEFSIEQKRTFLNQSLSVKLSNLFYLKKNYKKSLDLINELLREFKKLDDKPSLVDVHLLESKIYHKLRNLVKAKAALTASRTAANSIYCSSWTMANLDLMSGILHCEDKDYKTAYSYFFESFEGFHNMSGSGNTSNIYNLACTVLKYMLLAKIMTNLMDDVKTILNAKYTKETYQSRGINAMKAIAEAYSDRSLLEFNSALKTYKDELNSDELIRSHFNALYDTLLESNLCKIIEPFECVEISHITKIIGLDPDQVEGKLSQMILDKIFYGVLDQGNGWLYIFQNPHKDATYDSALELIGQLNKVSDQLFEKATVLY